MSARDADGFRLGRFVARSLDVAVVALVLYGAVVVHLGSNSNCARIRELDTVQSPTDRRPATWVTLQFKRQPTQGDTRDVRLVITSAALVRPLILDWTYIATHAQAMAKNGLNRVPAPLSAQQSPPSGRNIELLVPLSLKDRVNHVTNGLVEVDVELHWAGVEQDRTSGSVSCFYDFVPEK